LPVHAMGCSMAPLRMPSATQSVPLLLTAGDGPWAWRHVRYQLRDGAMDQTQMSHSIEAVRRFPLLGSLILESEEDGTTIHLEGERPLSIERSVSYEAAGVGHRVWDSALALAIYQRSALAAKLPTGARALEIGSGLGVPALDLARIAGIGSVTLTDSRAPLLALAQHNAERAAAVQQESARPFAAVRVAHLDWSHAGAGAGDEVEFDYVWGSDVCYEEAEVQPLAALLARLRAPLTVIIGPSSRPSMQLLAEQLGRMDVRVEERHVTLLAANADGGGGDDVQRLHSAGVHSVLLIRPGAACDCGLASSVGCVAVGPSA